MLFFQYKGTSSALSTIPVPKSLISRVPSSVEGINHELENVFIREDWEQGIQVGCLYTPAVLWSSRCEFYHRGFGRFRVAEFTSYSADSKYEQQSGGKTLQPPTCNYENNIWGISDNISKPQSVMQM